jgi:RNA polymerase sigma factor (sigma-70 family)
MATAGLAKVLDHLRKTLSPTELTALTDRQLLARFVSARDESAFAAMVAQHGNMVLGVCRRLLRCEQDAEDAFQATFLVLARKAGAIGWGDCAGPWLHEVATRTALEARSTIARRRAWERQEEVVPHPVVAPIEPCDWQPLLDQELRRLPEKYRTAVILCALEGRSRQEAALLLGVHEGTLSSRLASARKMLAERLTRRGVTPSAGALAVFVEGATAAATVPSSLVRSTITVATLVAAGADAAVTTSSAILMKGVLRAMFLQKLKWTAVVMMATVVLGAGGFAFQSDNGPAAARAQAPAAKPVSELEALRKENELLKLNLQVVLEKVRAQEAQIRELKEQHKLGVRVWDTETGRALREYERALALKVKLPEAANPLKEIDDALKLLRDAKDKDAKRRAVELLDKATRKLRDEVKEGKEGARPGR